MATVSAVGGISSFGLNRSDVDVDGCWNFSSDTAIRVVLPRLHDARKPNACSKFMPEAAEGASYLRLFVHLDR